MSCTSGSWLLVSPPSLHAPSLTLTVWPGACTAQLASAAVLQGADHGPAVGGGEDVSPGDEDTGAGPDPGPAGGRDQDGEGELPGQGQVPTHHPLCGHSSCQYHQHWTM